ncbi:gp37 [Shigella phage Buco]|uniref:Putative capsid protein n=1 Tax=Shigella phage Buco TaxID=2530183 RepID=A0A482JKU4_9CAUD|nr:gp37 [Shigella phage Buco]8ELD_A Chain A, Gp37 [Shigella phage Buco]8ELD_B Chain B, Gp37 [Shigella phage Buco]8ELD_C Chain C, Gp37 [Shigella phage Buco]8ELD_D Chain D, Gp37 [Shigella phage Buco]8ELD_E Chain E, Gp37 [Shigella phage Buco]8ELD_F Chain F, Gp37 [Shigella phage Buco]8ELD_G Chain G, Gp37 [Shigella phage Buco]8EM6_A Chain A, Gp37 [Shigella phage Buco]8EM6_B Chain B, Gp37 [Shigella phage Buco]8EM6_C Chain C, Gp37 [Shigella phage Buco]8EM6_D Chain D, Gp37 [Shigella phage Buco]
MANTDYAGNLTRPHWGGAASDVDIHLEVYQNEVDTRFQYQAMFLGLSSQRSVADRSNTYRIDRLNTSSVKGRTSGVALEPTPVRNDKMLIVVDTVLYIRNPIDYQDDWTAPDFLTEMGQNNGSEFAEVFDQAHLIQLIKGRSWVAPAHLKPAFSDGIEIEATIDSDVTTQAGMEANAIAINQAHKAGIDELIKRKVPLNDMITLVSTEIYSLLLEHPKLFNKDWGDANANGYKERRAVLMNGIPVVECTEFPDAGTHPLGSAYTVTADDAKCRMVTFSKSRTLVTVEAKPFTSRIWDDEQNFANVLDCYAMYQVGERRPDTAAVVKFNEAP